jgi:hypothetical protein
MWFKINAFGRVRNKEPWEVDRDSRLLCMGSWVGWALIFVRGIGVGCLKEWASHVATRFWTNLPTFTQMCKLTKPTRRSFATNPCSHLDNKQINSSSLELYLNIISLNLDP